MRRHEILEQKNAKKQSLAERINILVMDGFTYEDAESQAKEDMAKGKETK